MAQARVKSVLTNKVKIKIALSIEQGNKFQTVHLYNLMLFCIFKQNKVYTDIYYTSVS